MAAMRTILPPGPAGALFLEDLRKTLIHIGIATILTSLASAGAAGPVLRHLKQSAAIELVAFGVPEAFLTMAQLCLTLGILLCIPFILFRLLNLLPRLFSSVPSATIVGAWAVSTLLFYLGVVFCLKITLPYGIEFLLGFQTEHLRPLVSARKFVSFCTVFVFGFGLIFQLPLMMVLAGRLISLDVKKLSRHRRYAVVMITLLSAVLTPTPDILNQMLMGVPLYLLFEIGLMGMRWFK